LSHGAIVPSGWPSAHDEELRTAATKLARLLSSHPDEIDVTE
jgi:hypothetical protein